MPRPASIVLFALALLICASGGCTCFRKKTDEELLRKEIDDVRVHLYLSAKIALHPTAGGPEVKEARSGLQKLLALTDKALGKKGSGASGSLSSEEAASMALVLYKLRGHGKEALAKDKVDVPPPILPTLVAALDEGGEYVDVIDAPTEHAILLTGFSLMKLHPKTPVPIPPKVLLYEAWYARTNAITLQGFANPVRAIKAYTFSVSKLCDLASREASSIQDDDPIDRKEIERDAKRLTGAKVKLGDDEALHLGAAVSTLAHGSAAYCFLVRGEERRATPHITSFLDAAEKIGVKSAETEVLRAFVECSEGDAAAGRRRLRAAKENGGLGKDGRETVEQLSDSCGKGSGEVAKALDKAVYASAFARIALTHLQKSGLGEALEDTALYRAVRGFVVSLGDTLAAAKDALPSAEGIKEGVTEKVKSITD